MHAYANTLALPKQAKIYGALLLLVLMTLVASAATTAAASPPMSTTASVIAMTPVVDFMETAAAPAGHITGLLRPDRVQSWCTYVVTGAIWAAGYWFIWR